MLYRVADVDFRINFADKNSEDWDLIPSFNPFIITESESQTFDMTVLDQVDFIQNAEEIQEFDTGNAIIDVSRTVNTHQFIIHDFNRKLCSILIADKDFKHCQCELHGSRNERSYGLNNALMLSYAFSACQLGVLLIHASLVRCEGKGYAFIAKSGTGKSTHTGLWLSNIPGCDLMNDDNPVVRIVDGQATIYGSPWSGKTPCYRQVSAPLAAITLIQRDKENRVEKMDHVSQFFQTLGSCSSMRWDHDTYTQICNNISALMECTPYYVMHCLPDNEAAIVCHRTLTMQK